jgi:protein-L-isoaspartate(D-aspartate) O-methyltransferase
MKAWRAIAAFPAILGCMSVNQAGGNGHSDEWRARCERMVRTQIEERGVKSPRVLAAVRATPRHLFIPRALEARAWDDMPLPIGWNQTISQPYIVASMSEHLDLEKSHRVLEIGTGSGYQAAILSQLSGEVFSIEIVPQLAQQSSELLQRQGYRNVTVRCGDGYEGWPEKAPFDRIILTASPPEIPQKLIDQLKPGGKLVAPEGRTFQELVVVEKDLAGKVSRRSLYAVQFVPMVRD